MAIREIIIEGDDRLRKKSRLVEDVMSPRIQALIDDLIDTLYESGTGIGLAAVQIGVLRRIFVVDLMDGSGLHVYVNPEWVHQTGVQTGQEGCLSLPGYWAEVQRPESVRIRAMDREGNWFEREASGLEAVCLCHEFDHLEGQLFKDRAIPGTEEHA